MLLSPCSHDERIVDRNACNLLDAFAPQVLSFLHKARQVSLKEHKTRSTFYNNHRVQVLRAWLHLGAARSERSRDSKQNSLFALKKLIHGHLVSWLTLLHLHCRKRFTDLKMIEEKEKINKHMN